MPSSSSVVKASKEIIESYTNSSSEKSNLTTTFTDNTVSEKVSNSILDKVLKIVKHPKIKWILIALILCAIILFYFKTQNNKKIEGLVKKTQKTINLPQNKDQVQSQDINALIEKEMKDKLMREKILREHLMQQQYQQQQQQFQQQQYQQQQHNQSQSRPKQNVVQPAPIKELSENESESDDEIFIEDKNVMNHNLTMDEMNAIDKQLEDVNIDHIMNNQ
jgi:hypothetical protein